MNTTCEMPCVSAREMDAKSDALKKKLRTMKWKPEAVMRETVLIQRLRELVVDAAIEG